MSRSDQFALMGTDLCTSESLEGLYCAKPTTEILSTQPTINISMEEMSMTVSESSVEIYSLLPPEWGAWLEQVPTTSTAVWDHAALHAPCCLGGGHCTQEIGDNSSSGVCTAVESREQQQYVTLSSAAAGLLPGYMAVVDFAKKIIYLRTLLCSMGFAQDGTTTEHNEHNTACIEWRNNIIGCHERTKNIDIRKHFTHGAIKNGHMILRKIVTTSQLADIMCIKSLLGQPLEPSNKSVVAQEGED